MENGHQLTQQEWQQQWQQLVVMNNKRPIVDTYNGITAMGDEYFDSFPPGYRFCPHDGELVFHYLIKKASNERLPPNRIPEVNLYDYHPQDLTGMYRVQRGEDWYFFTQRNRKYPKGLRPNRAAYDGHWKPVAIDEDVIYEDKRVGYKMTLDFLSLNGERTVWKMHEYRIHKRSIAPPSSTNGSTSMKLDDWVLCKIYRNSRDKKNNNQQQQHPTEELATTANVDQDVPATDSASKSDGNDLITANVDQDVPIDSALKSDGNDLINSHVGVNHDYMQGLVSMNDQNPTSCSPNFLLDYSKEEEGQYCMMIEATNHVPLEAGPSSSQNPVLVNDLDQLLDCDDMNDLDFSELEELMKTDFLSNNA